MIRDMENDNNEEQALFDEIGDWNPFRITEKHSYMFQYSSRGCIN